MRYLLPYFIARSNASALDRQGPPSRLTTALVMIPAAIVVIGFAGLFAVAIGSFVGWELFGI